jgi:hypothetical protein
VTTFGNSLVRVADTSISGVDVGILANNGNGLDANAGTTTNLTATNNAISAGTYGISLTASGTSSSFAPPSVVVANIASNKITSGTTGINLLTQNPVTSPGAARVIRISNAASALELGAINFNTTVVDTPVTDPSQVFWNSPPPALPPQPVPLVPTPP